MSFTPNSGTSTPVPNQSAANQKKPSLAGANNKQRKGVAKAQAKFEPNVFRDEFLKALNTNPNPEDLEAYGRILESLANELDFRKYEAQLFELLIVGRLMAPGGNVITNDGSEICPFAVCELPASQQQDASNAEKDNKRMKDIVGVWSKLIRRYKYLQKPLEESSLPNIMQNSNKLDKAAAPSAVSAGTLGVSNAGAGESTPGGISGTATPNSTSGSASSLSLPSFPRPRVERLASFVALMVASGQLPPATLGSMKRDHLVKDGTSLAFLLTYLKTYLTSSGETLDHLTTSLRRNGNSDLLDFFPLQRRSVVELQKEFKTNGLEKLTDWYGKVVEGLKKEEIVARLKELTNDDDEDDGRAGNEEIIKYIQSASKTTTLQDVDLITLIWNGLMSNLDQLTPASSSDQQVNEAVLKWIKSVNPVLGAFTKNARTEIALINAIQVFIYSTSTRLIPVFPRIIQSLYNEDTLSSQAIFYWFEKGAKPQGKQTFLKNMEGLVKAIKQSEESDEDEDDE